jgi:phage-related protein
MLQMADGFSKMENPAKRAADAQALLGRGGAALQPLFFKGSKAIQDQLNMANKYGATVGDKTTKSMADLIDKQREMKMAFEGVKVQLGTALLPMIVKLAAAVMPLVRELAPMLAKVLVGIVNAAKPLLPVVMQLVGVLGKSLMQALDALAPAMPKIAKAFSDLITAVAPILPPLITLATQVLVMLIKSPILDWIITLVTWFAKLATFVAKNKPLLYAVLIAIAAMIGPVTTLITVGLLLWKNWDKITKALVKAWEWVRDTVIGGAKYVFNWVKRNWPLLLGILTGPIGLAVALIAKNWDAITKGAKDAWDKIVGTIEDAFTGVGKWLSSTGAALVGGFVDGITGAYQDVVKAVSAIKGKVTDNVTKAATWLSTQGGDAVAGLITGITDKFKDLATAAGKIAGKVKDNVTDAATWLYEKGKNATGGLIGGITDKFKDVATAAGKLAGKVKDNVTDAATWLYTKGKNAVGGLIDGIKDALDGIGTVMGKVVDAVKAPINKVIGLWNTLSFTVPRISVPKIGGVSFHGHTIFPGFGGWGVGPWKFDFPNIKKLAAGGVIDSPTLALVGEGKGREIVTPESLLRQIVAQMVPVVHVYIGDTELRDLVRVEAVGVDNATARAILGGSV